MSPRPIATEAELRKLIRRWAPRLGLADWRIDVIIGELEGDNAEVRQHEHEYREAVIVFPPWFVGLAEYPDGQLRPRDHWAPGDAEATVVHELLHLATKPIARALALMDGQIHPHTEAVLEGAVTAAEERVVDNLARALVAAWRTR